MPSPKKKRKPRVMFWGGMYWIPDSLLSDGCTPRKIEFFARWLLSVAAWARSKG